MSSLGVCTLVSTQEKQSKNDGSNCDARTNRLTHRLPQTTTDDGCAHTAWEILCCLIHGRVVVPATTSMISFLEIAVCVVCPHQRETLKNCYIIKWWRWVLSATRVTRSLCLVAAVLVLTVTLLLQPVGLANAQGPGDYIVTELSVDILSAVTPGGVRTVIYTFAAGTLPVGVAIPPISPVGGVMTLANKAVILTPYLALVGLLLAASVLLVLRGRQRS